MRNILHTSQHLGLGLVDLPRLCFLLLLLLFAGRGCIFSYYLRNTLSLWLFGWLGSCFFLDHFVLTHLEVFFLRVHHLTI